MKEHNQEKHGKESVRLGVLTRVSFAHLLIHEPPHPEKSHLINPVGTAFNLI